MEDEILRWISQSAQVRKEGPRDPPTKVLRKNSIRRRKLLCGLSFVRGSWETEVRGHKNNLKITVKIFVYIKYYSDICTNQLKPNTMIDVQIDLGKTEEEGNNIFGTDENITESMVEKIIKRVMNEPTFRRGKLDTQLSISSFRMEEGKIEVLLGGFDEMTEDPDDDDVWYEQEYVYDLIDFS
jgi:hypothetical protein